MWRPSGRERNRRLKTGRIVEIDPAQQTAATRPQSQDATIRPRYGQQ
jgi:hypothetical protein